MTNNENIMTNNNASRAAGCGLTDDEQEAEPRLDLQIRFSKGIADLDAEKMQLVAAIAAKMCEDCHSECVAVYVDFCQAHGRPVEQHVLDTLPPVALVS